MVVTSEPSRSIHVECTTLFVNRYDSKLYGLFQSIHDVHVWMFALYVQEYPPGTSGPNAGSAYIAYLDSGIGSAVSKYIWSILL